MYVDHGPDLPGPRPPSHGPGCSDPRTPARRTQARDTHARVMRTRTHARDTRDSILSVAFAFQKSSIVSCTYDILIQKCAFRQKCDKNVSSSKYMISLIFSHFSSNSSKNVTKMYQSQKSTVNTINDLRISHRKRLKSLIFLCLRK